MSSDVMVSAELAGPAPRGSAGVLEAYAHSVMNTFGPPKRVFVRGEGCYVWDADGRRHLDLLAGIAVNALGHAHPTVLAAVTGQISTLGHVSNFFATPAQVALATRLAGLTGDDDAKVFFTNSGTEANEAAFKLTRMTGRTKIISTEGAFHGRSMGALAVTHNPKYRAPFEPLPGEVTFVPYGDAEALAAVVDETVAAVVLEPIQGENGVVVPSAGYLARARELCDAAGALLWIDEVQTGMGRTGSWLVHTAQGVRADVVTLAKGLGNGFPIGACIATGRAATMLQPGSHGSTFGGNPVAAIAGLAVMNVIERDGLLDQVTATGEHLVSVVMGLGHPLVSEVRGRGLLRGIVLNADVGPAVADLALEAGFVINAPRPHVLRIAPPLVVTPAQLDTFVEALPGLLDAASGAAS
ncbi:acetylornithine aminotransferase apoenzyme [Microlunatus sagamiharensis]|uniref:Acetylornithine aminotransferase n=2 Tax=Microlunatus sagamiharensis TaxID=546874 RepID=A0A1H2LWX0_9ACTN|nr:acetylornithine aminotransferase apoenzyme [Microlunatus sagamiharensis]